MEWADADGETLFQACANRSNPEAWNEFVRRFGLLISRTAFRTAQRWTQPGQELVDDLVQEIYLKLCADGGRALRNFRLTHEGSEFGFLKVFAANSVTDHFKQRNAKKHGGGSVFSLENIPEPAAIPQRLEHDIMVREIEEALRHVAQGPAGDRDRWIFLLYFRHGFTAKAIAALPAVELTCEGVESVLARLTKALRARFAATVEPQRSKTRASEGAA